MSGNNRKVVEADLCDRRLDSVIYVIVGGVLRDCDISEVF